VTTFHLGASRHEHPNFSSSDIALETLRASALLRQLSPLFSCTRFWGEPRPCLRNEFTREGGLHGLRPFVALLIHYSTTARPIREGPVIERRDRGRKEAWSRSSVIPFGTLGFWDLGI